MSKGKIQIIIPVVVLFALIIGVIYRLHIRSVENQLYTGTIEQTQANITTSVSGYLEQLHIEEGMTVKKGDVIAVIRRHDLEAQVAQQRAALATAKFNLLNLEEGSRPTEINVAAANTAQAKSQMEKAALYYHRMASLLSQGAVAQQTYDDAKAAYEALQSAYDAAAEQEKQTREGNRKAVIDAARGQVEQMEGALKASESLAKDTIIVSPLDGVIYSKNFQNNEYVGAGASLATVYDGKDMWVKIYVTEAELGHIKVGQAVDVMIDSYPDKVFTGHISEISNTAEYAPRQSITKNERPNMVFFVKVRLPDENGLFKAGMPADVKL